MLGKVLVSLCVLLAACAHPTADAPPVSAAPSATPVSTATPTKDATAVSCKVDLECSDGQLCISGHCANITPELAECAVSRVHFAFNSDDFDLTERPKLDRMARCLRAEHTLHVTIEGNADERGTEEYNLALGDRRANKVENYLKVNGVSDKQLKPITYGKENPLCTEHNEECWAKNRRTALKPKIEK